jgi:hypothetical protein
MDRRGWCKTSVDRSCSQGCLSWFSRYDNTKNNIKNRNMVFLLNPFPHCRCNTIRNGQLLDRSRTVKKVTRPPCGSTLGGRPVAPCSALCGPLRALWVSADLLVAQTTFAKQGGGLFGIPRPAPSRWSLSRDLGVPLTKSCSCGTSTWRPRITFSNLRLKDDCGYQMARGRPWPGLPSV